MADPEKQTVEDVDQDEIEEIDEEVESGEGDAGAPTGEMVTQVMQNPGVLAALQDRLTSMVGQPSGYIQSLPKVVKRRLKALKKLQFESIKIESKFYEEVHDMECRYAALYQPLFERRKDILNGTVEPTDSDCDWPSDEEEEEEEKKLAEDMKDKAKISEDKEKKAEEEKTEEEDPKGVPQFWLTVFKNVEMLSEMVQEHDEPILQHLNDIKVKFSPSSQMGFTLEFYFGPNDHFTNTVLTKEYGMRAEPDPTDPFSFEGPEIIKCKGCTIDWKKGKNVTVKVIKKVQKHKGRGTKRTVTKTVQNDSFFNFFNPPEVPEGEEPDEDLEALLASDFEIGHFLRERVVPRAVLYFTGEALEDDDDFDDEEGEEEGDEEDGEYDEDGDPDFNPQAGQKPADCKQQ